MGNRDWGSLLADYASAFTLQNRLLTLHFGGAGPADNVLLHYVYSVTRTACASGDVEVAGEIRC